MGTSVRSGSLRHLADVRNTVRTKNKHGEEEISYVTVGQAYVAVDPVRGREYSEARSLHPELEVVITMRPDPLVRSDSQIVVLSDGDEETYEVLGPPIDVGKLGKRMELLCKRATHES